jgi:hypothetical protein
MRKLVPARTAAQLAANHVLIDEFVDNRVWEYHQSRPYHGKQFRAFQTA